MPPTMRTTSLQIGGRKWIQETLEAGWAAAGGVVVVVAAWWLRWLSLCPSFCVVVAAFVVVGSVFSFFVLVVVVVVAVVVFVSVYVFLFLLMWWLLRVAFVFVFLFLSLWWLLRFLLLCPCQCACFCCCGGCCGALLFCRRCCTF